MKNTFFVIGLLTFLLFFGITSPCNAARVTISKLEQKDADWLPKWKSDVVITIEVTVPPHFSGGELQASLSYVTIYKGVCGNYGNMSEDDLWLDVSKNSDPLDLNNSWKWVDARTLKIKIPPDNAGIGETFNYELKVSCRDTAAFGILTVSTSSSQEDDTETLRIPRDVNPENKIADAWENTYCNAAQKADIERDKELVATYNINEGDGLSIIAEYCGFSERLTRDADGNVTDIHHFRCSPSQKDFFAIIEAGLANHGCGTASRLPNHSCHILSSECVMNPDGPKEGDTADDSRYVNFNNEDLPGYHQVWAIDVITSVDIIPSGDGWIFGNASISAPAYWSEAIIYTTTLTEKRPADHGVLLPIVIGHEIAHNVNLNHCPLLGGDLDCYMLPNIEVTHDNFDSHHVRDYATTFPHETPQQPGFATLPGGDEEEDQDDVVGRISTNTGPSTYGCDYNAEYDYCTDMGTCTTRTDASGIGMCGHRWCCCAPITVTSTTPSTSVTSTNTGSSSYGCDYNAEYDYCTDTGTCTTRSGEFGIGMCGHRWCCCAPITVTSTTPSTSVTSTNTGSSSYGCDYNAEYDYCTDTGTCTTRSGEFGIGMCGHRWCCCAPQ